MTSKGRYFKWGRGFWVRINELLAEAFACKACGGAGEVWVWGTNVDPGIGHT